MSAPAAHAHRPVVAALTLDGDPEAVLALAHRLSPRAPVAVHAAALPPIPVGAAAAGAPFPAAAVSRSEGERLRLRALADADAMLRRLAPQAEHVALVGDPADQLARVAAERDALAIVAGRRRRGGVRAALLGSVTRALADQAPCPVVLCLETEPASPLDGPVVVGLPIDEDDAERVTAAGRALAEALDLPVLLVRADGSTSTGRRAAAPQALDDGVDLVEVQGRAAAVLRDVAGQTRSPLVVVGKGSGLLKGLVGHSTSSELSRTLMHPLALVPLERED